LLKRPHPESSARHGFAIGNAPIDGSVRLLRADDVNLGG
jgi:hypothetical protein